MIKRTSLTNEVITGDCNKEYLKGRFIEVFNILSQSDLVSRIDSCKPEFRDEAEYFDASSRGGEWQRPTQLHHFDTGKYIGTITRVTDLYSDDHADPSLSNQRYGEAQTYEVSFSMYERFRIRYALKEELECKTKKPQIKSKQVVMPHVRSNVIRNYKDHEGNGTGLNIPDIPYYKIQNLVDVKLEYPTDSQVKIVVGKENPLEFLVDLEGDSK